jgi:lysophospholipase L1-like esterase
MTTSQPATRLRVVLLVAALSALALGVSAARAAAYPSSMDGLGDSITRAYNTCPFAFTDCTENSWSTGTSTKVDSYYARLLALNSAIKGRNYNDAVSGAKMSELKKQASNAVSRKVELVTILMGSNDACTSSLSTMTSVSTYQSEYEEALKTLTSGLPNVQIKVLSVPNAYMLWELFHTNSSAVNTWNNLKICQSLLANPTSTAASDEERRLAVHQREEEFDSVLQSGCAQYSQCQFDGDAGFNTKFSTNDVSTRDYFHPSVEGQALLAATAWKAVGY